MAGKLIVIEGLDGSVCHAVDFLQQIFDLLRLDALTVDLDHPVPAVEIDEVAVFVKKLFCSVYAHDFSKEHRMRAEKLRFCNFTFKRYRTFFYKRNGNFVRRRFMKAAFSEFIDFSSRFSSAEISFAAHGRSCKIYRKLP